MIKCAIKARMTADPRFPLSDDQRNRFAAAIEKSHNVLLGSPSVTWENDRQALVLIRTEALNREQAEATVGRMIRENAAIMANIAVQSIEIVEVDGEPG